MSRYDSWLEAPLEKAGSREEEYSSWLERFEDQYFEEFLEENPTLPEDVKKWTLEQLEKWNSFLEEQWTLS